MDGDEPDVQWYTADDGRLEQSLERSYLAI
jgi:hypothetical protein